MSDNALTTLENLPVNEQVESYFGELSKGGFNFLPRLQLCGSSTKLAKEGRIPVNHYALVHSADSFDDMTKSVIVIPLRLRLKALDTSGDSPLSYYNPEGPEFRRIYERSTVKNSGCMAGPEFLIWIPDKERFATFYFSAPTARPESVNMKGRLGLACQLDSRMANSKKTGNTWALPIVKPYSSPVTMPNPAETEREIIKFATEKDSEIVAVAASETERAR